MGNHEIIMKNVTSTLVKGGSCKLLETFDTHSIINNYANENKIDVSRFFKGIDNIELYECETSGYRFYYPEQIIGDAKFYKDLAKARTNYYSNRWEHLKALNYISKTDKILEIGSGFGSFLELLKQNNIKDLKGLELSELAVDECVKKGLDVESKLIEDFDLDNTFDIVCSFQVLEHIYDVKSFLDSSIRLLKPGGKLIVGVPNNNPYLHVSDKNHTLNLPPHHAGLWSQKSLSSLSDLYNLKQINTKFEPLLNSYDYFINFHSNNNKSKLVRVCLKVLNKIIPKLTKMVLNKVVKGRNILMVFQK